MDFIGTEPMQTQGYTSRTPRVSVVMPVHNAAAYVERAVRSVLASDLPELEVIVVDDGSQDASASIVESIADPRVLLLRMSASGGPSRPRNAGIARARAPYVALLDSDDELKPGKLAAAVDALDRHPAVGLAFTDFESIDEDGTLICQSVLGDYRARNLLTAGEAQADWRVIPQRELARALVYENFIGTSGVVLRKALLADIGAFDESLTYSEDRDLWFRLAHHGDALYWNRIGHSYRIRRGSLTAGPGIPIARARIAVLERERKRWSRSERAVQRQIDSLVAANLAAIGYEERRRRRLQAIVLFARAFVLSREIRWLRALLGSLFSVPRHTADT